MQNHVVELTSGEWSAGQRVATARYDSKPYHSTDGDDGPIARVVVQEIEVRQGARVIKRISGAQLQAQRGFTADKWTDSQGRQAFRGEFAMGVTG